METTHERIEAWVEDDQAFSETLRREGIRVVDELPQLRRITPDYSKPERPAGLLPPLRLMPDSKPEQAVIAQEELQRTLISAVEPQQIELPPPPLDNLRHHLQTRFPVLYAQVLEPTLADLRQEHSAALAEGHPLKAWWGILRGCVALAAAAIYQLGFSLLGRIAALWQARSPK